MTLMKKIVLAVMAAGMLLAVFLESVPAEESHSGHDMGDMAMSADSPSTRGYMAAMKKMDDDMMAMKYTGDADADFVRGMIPHHQGAIDMARVVLEHGKDPGIRKLAEGVVKAQEAEIRQMQEWLKAHGR
jgi:uncharacterized protein (DUF305 family)